MAGAWSSPGLLGAHPVTLDRGIIFDFCGLLEDGRVGAAVTGAVCHEQEQVASGNLLHHECLLAAPTLDDAIGFLDGRLMHEHWVLCVTGVQQVLLLVLVGVMEDRFGL